MKSNNTTQEPFEPCCRATTIGSLPHTDVEKGIDLLFEFTPDIPGWPQFPKRDIHENMMVQFTEGLPGIAKKGDRMILDSSSLDFTEKMTAFYEAYINVTENDNYDDLNYFGISDRYAVGFTGLMQRLNLKTSAAHTALKGCVTGPFTLGVNLVDQNNRMIYYDEQLRDMIIKNAEMKSRWQIQQLKTHCPRIIIAVDEPALLYYGSQMFLTVSREDIISDLNAVADQIHSQNGLAAIHCEEDTDWSLIMETRLDILLFDAYDHMRGIALHPEALKSFLDRGGCLGWGIVPTLNMKAAENETVDSLLERFEEGMAQLTERGFDRDFLLRRALITPSCGMGGVLTPPLAERGLSILRQISEILQGEVK